MPENKLKPCPFCAFPAELLHEYDQENDKRFSIHCVRCEMRGPLVDTRNEAIEYWNSLPRISDIERYKMDADWLAQAACSLCYQRTDCEVRRFASDACKLDGSYFGWCKAGPKGVEEK